MEINLQIKSCCSELATIHTALADLREQWLISKKVIMEINLILDEIVANIATHGGCNKDSKIDIRLTKQAGVITITVADDGLPFDPTIKLPPDISLPLEKRKCGGLGIHLIRKFSNSCEYQRIENKNVLTIKKTNPRRTGDK